MSVDLSRFTSHLGVFLAAIFFNACALPAAGANPVVEIADGPLFSGSGNVHPNLLLSLSVEFPTVGIAYRGDDGHYNRTREYIGYFNPGKCYDYQGGNRNLDDDGYFFILKDADTVTHECGGDSFSGNFMNWASSSAIDMLRYAMTGGDRLIDTPQLTVLQRAVLRDSPSGNFYAHSTYFPRRTLTSGGNASAPIAVTPFMTGTLYIVSCRNRILFSNVSSGLEGNKDADSKKASAYCTSEYDGKQAPPAEAVDKSLGEYLVRVKVCDAKEGPTRKDLCRKYGNHYKPVGELQRRADKLRVAAMGYLLDDAAARYGGVLRAPMKYLGANKIDAPDFLKAANERREWNPDTGVFYSNPEDPANPDSTTVNSGVINYLNKFGRSGKYKTYDPVGELYYEGVRYLQGRQPTAASTAGMNEAMKDGFPVIETWVDPVVASCQRNYILAIADVNTHWDRHIPGNQRTTYGNGSDAHDDARAADSTVAGKTPALDVKKWTDLVGEMEVDAASTYTNPATNQKLTALGSKDTGSGGHGTHYMAGLAYWANTNDIRLDKPTRIKTFTIDVDEGGDGKIDNNKRALQPRDSQLYLAAKYGGFKDKNGDGNPFITLAGDGKTELTGNNAEWDNGSGVPANYFLASQPTEMIESIRKVFASIGGASGSISGVAVSTTRLSSDGAHVYQPEFDPERWSGSLRKRSLTLDADGKAGIAANAEWDAGQILTGASGEPAKPSPADRKIFTAISTDDNALSTVEFKWAALSDAQQALLNSSPTDLQSDGLGEERLSYLRGDRSREIGQPDGIFRKRDHVLGDIVNSNPVFVAAPSPDVQGDGYQSFYEKNKKRTAAVYVGANDGMLHAFDADKGTELFAYVPNALLRHLNQLTSPDYVHRPYMDGGIAVAEAYAGGKWKTVLAAGMGGGAQGVVALDVTNPAKFGDSTDAIFEFTDLDDPDMGNLTGPPTIVKFRVGTKLGLPEYKYFVVVPGGLNSYKDDGDGKFNNDGAGALFLLSLDKHPSAPWKLGSNYFKFRTPSKDDALQNGLSAPAPVVDANGAVRYAYAGDLQGNLWRFDFTGDAPWSGALSGKTPFFTARDADENHQPITAQPRVAFAPGGGYLVLFGTGKFIEESDASKGSFATQSFYAIHDTLEDAVVAGRSALSSRTLAPDKSGGLTVSGAAFLYGAGDKYKKGWYFDFPESDSTGERNVTNGLLLDGLLFFNTLIPGSDPCAAGSGRSYMVNAISGLPPEGEPTGFMSAVGMLGSPVAFSAGAEIGARNAVGRREVKKKHTVFTFGTGGAKGTAAPAQNGDGETIARAGRFSWREILNWQELQNAIKKK